MQREKNFSKINLDQGRLRTFFVPCTSSTEVIQYIQHRRITDSTVQRLLSTPKYNPIFTSVFASSKLPLVSVPVVGGGVQPLLLVRL